MNELYYHGDKAVSKEVCDKAREVFLQERFEYAMHEENLIPYEELDYYLEELEKFDKN